VCIQVVCRYGQQLKEFARTPSGNSEGDGGGMWFGFQFGGSKLISNHFKLIKKTLNILIFFHPHPHPFPLTLTLSPSHPFPFPPSPFPPHPFPLTLSPSPFPFPFTLTPHPHPLPLTGTHSHSLTPWGEGEIV
jgi:hypothetical protein